jgi:ketosteroid isomerase-like protein
VSLVRQIGKAISDGDIGAIEGLLSDDFVWHYLNPQFSDLAGDYHGHAGLTEVFSRLAYVTGGTFKIESISATPAGDELVVTHVRPKVSSDGRQVETDAVVVWRMHDGRIAEVWDVPAVYSTQERAELDS